METGQTILLLINPLANKKKIEDQHPGIECFILKKIDFHCFTQSWPAEINIYKEIKLIC